MPTQQSISADSSLLRLRRAIASNDPDAIRIALPDPSSFLTSVFRLPNNERDAVLVGVLPALEAEEDIWQITEAAAMNDIARPNSRALVMIAPYIRADQLADALNLARAIPDAEASIKAQQAIRVRAAELSDLIDR